MYTFLKPRYQIYPYSQHDIPPTPDYQHTQNQLHYLRHYPTALVESDPHYFNKQAHNAHTSVEVQPSHSYEIKQTEHGYRTIYHGNGGHSSPEYNHGGDDGQSVEPVPVIVLRVPGPTKYAAHLQTLLQQYLEARASQYIQAFQEQEAQGIDSSQQIDHGQEAGYGGYGDLPVLPYGAHQAYLPAQMYIHPISQIQPYYGQHAMANPYASGHVTQPISIESDEDHDHIAATPSPANYYSHGQAQSSDETDQHTGKIFQIDFTPHKQ